MLNTNILKMIQIISIIKGLCYLKKYVIAKIYLSNISNITNIYPVKVFIRISGEFKSPENIVFIKSTLCYEKTKYGNKVHFNHERTCTKLKYD